MSKQPKRTDPEVLKANIKKAKSTLEVKKMKAEQSTQINKDKD